jgi:tetratricopeptide (TPR) repeat protein
MGVFVGEARQRVVDDLVDRVQRLQHPELVVLSAPLGSGKTRIVQEVYRRLAAEQSEPRYWPPAIIDPDEAGIDPGRNRKLVSPAQVSAVRGADMRFLWWGVSCQERQTGRLLDAVLGDGEELTRHAAAMYARWSNGRKLKKLLRDPETHARATAFVGLIGAVAGPLGLLAGAAAKGFELVTLVLDTKDQVDDARDLADAARGAIEEVRDRARDVDEGATIDLTSTERLAEVELMATSLCASVAGAPRLPTIIVVDDAHWADANVIHLLRTIVAHPDAPVLVVATTWPEKLAAQQLALDETGLAHVAAAHHTRTTVHELEQLGADALGDLVRELAPRTAPGIVAALGARADGNPLALRLMLARQVVRESVVDDALTLTPAEIAAIQSDIHSLYRDLWNELPDAVRTTLCAAAMLDEDVVVPLAVAAATAMGVAAAAERLGEAETPYRWVREVEDLVVRFTEVVRRDLAHDHEVAEARRAAARTALVTEASARALAGDLPPAVHERVLRAIVTFSREGLNEDISLAYAAARALADLTAARYDDMDELAARQAVVDWSRQLFTGDDVGQLVVDLHALAGSAADVGSHALAAACYQESHHLLVTLAERRPDSLEALRNLSVSHNRLGDLAAASGDLVGARRQFEEGLAIALVLVERQPDSIAALRDLGVSRSKLGDVAVAVGDLVAARERFEEAHDLMVTLAEQRPDRLEALRDLSVSHNRLGDLLVALGDLVGARGRFEEALSMREQLMERQPNSLEALRDLFVSHNKLGEVAVELGDHAVARERFEDGLAITRKLVDLQPDSIEALRDLNIIHNKLGLLAVELGDLVGARERVEEGLAIALVLVERQQDSIEALRDLSVSHNLLGDLARRAGDLTAASEHLRIDLDLAQRLADLQPDSVEARRDVVLSRSAMARVTTGVERREHLRAGLEAAADLLVVVGSHFDAPSLAVDQVLGYLGSFADGDGLIDEESFLFAINVAARARDHGAELPPPLVEVMDQALADDDG